MKHNQECLKQWMASEKNVNPSKLVLVTYKKGKPCKD